VTGGPHDREVNHAHGEASAYVDVAGYSLERGFDRIEWLLEEGRWRQCGFDTLEAFLESINLKLFKPVIEQRQRIVAAIKREDARVSNRKIAKALNVDPETVNRDVRAANAAPRSENSNENNVAEKLSAANAAPAFGGEAAGKHANAVERGARELLESGATQLLAVAFADGRVSLMDALKIAADFSADEQDAMAVLPEGELVKCYKANMRGRGREKWNRDHQTAPLLDGEKQYPVLYPDPPWEFEVYSEDTGQGRAAAAHYRTMSLPELCDLQIDGRPVTAFQAQRMGMESPKAAVAADDCAMFMWTTAPHLPDALKLLQAWGFEYKTHCVWVKDKIGLGFWFRNRHEILLVATQGEVRAPVHGTQWESVIEAPRSTRHSQKPVEGYELIEAYFPGLPKLEMFARNDRAGWDCWGDEAPAPIEAAR
jgi:N6-adenosine-specific RNA methylase IME4